MANSRPSIRTRFAALGSGLPTTSPTRVSVIVTATDYSHPVSRSASSSTGGLGFCTRRSSPRGGETHALVRGVEEVVQHVDGVLLDLCVPEFVHALAEAGHVTEPAADRARVQTHPAGDCPLAHAKPEIA
jgi:hypothetical protein